MINRQFVEVPGGDLAAMSQIKLRQNSSIHVTQSAKRQNSPAVVIRKKWVGGQIHPTKLANSEAIHFSSKPENR